MSWQIFLAFSLSCKITLTTNILSIFCVMQDDIDHPGPKNNLKLPCQAQLWAHSFFSLLPAARLCPTIILSYSVCRAHDKALVKCLSFFLFPKAKSFLKWALVKCPDSFSPSTALEDEHFALSHSLDGPNMNSVTLCISWGFGYLRLKDHQCSRSLALADEHFALRH